MTKAKLCVGGIYPAVVTELLSYGVAITVDGLNGVVKLPEVCWFQFGLQNRLDQEIQLGETRLIKVLAIVEDYVYASFRQATPELNPWAPQRMLHAGELTRGEVVSVTDYGYWLKLENDALGLLLAAHAVAPLKLNDFVQVVVIDIDVARQHIIVEQHLPWIGP